MTDSHYLLAVSRAVQSCTSLDDLCQRVLGHVASAMQFPEAAAPTVEVDGEVFSHDRWEPAYTNALQARITLDGTPRGLVRVFSPDERPFLLPEEQDVVSSAAEMIAMWLERRQAVEALRSSEERFRLSVTNMLDPFEIYSAVREPAGRIVDFRVDYVNEAAWRATGLAPEEHVGGTLLDRFPAVKRLGLFDDYVRLVEAGSPVSKDGFRYDGEFMGRDVRGVFDIRAVPLDDGFAVTWRDVTDRYEAEEALRRRDGILEAVSFAAEQLLRSPSWRDRIDVVLGSLRVATGVTRVRLFRARVDEDGIPRVTLVAEAGDPAAPAALDSGSRPLTDLAYLQEGLGRWREIMRSGLVVHGITSQMPEPERWFLESQSTRSFALFPIAAGKEGWGVLAFNDCELEREWSGAERDALRTAAHTLGAAIEREAAESTKSELLQVLSHELLTPVSIIQASVATLVRRPFSADLLAEISAGVVRANARMSRLVQNITTAANLGRPGDPIATEPVVVDDLLARSVAAVAAVASDAGRVALPEASPDFKVSAHPGLAPRAIGEVLDNALRLSDRPVEVSVVRRGREAEVCVADRGSGIPGEIAQRMLELFTQEDSSVTRIHPGVGIGLYLASRIMRAQGGRIEIRERSGGGTVVALVFPGVVHDDST